MKKKNILPTVTVAISAYNEEKNIGFLLDEIISQKEKGFHIEKIIICSDGSTDNTSKIINSYKSKKIILLDEKQRRGKAYRLNQIIKISNSEILVMLDADIFIKNSFLIELIKPIIKNKADLTSSKAVGLEPHTLIERILVKSHEYKNSLYETFNKGENVYTCHGIARAFSKKLYKNFRFDDSVAEDAFSYLYVVANNYAYAYTPKAVALLKLPETISDHKKQSVRFLMSQEYLSKYFDINFVHQNYSLPKKLLIANFLKFLIRHPLEMSSYIFIYVLMKANATFTKEISNVWDIATSSKGGQI